MIRPFRPLAVRVVLLIVSVALAGCSAEARKARRLAQAKTLLDAGNYDSAEIEYMNVLKSDPANPEAIGRLGILYFDQGRMGRVLGFLMRAREVQPENLEMRIRLGKCFLAMGRFEDARNEALFVLQRQPQLEDAPILLAGASARPAEVEDARRRLQALPPAVAGSAPVIVALGTLDLRLGKNKEAEAAFARAESVSPQSGVAQSAIGAMYWSQNDHAKAERAFAIAAENSPIRSSRRLQYGQFKLRTNDLTGARQFFEGLLKQAPDYLPAYMGLAEVAGMEKKYDEAVETLAKVINRDNAHPDAQLMTGRILLEKGNAPKAVAELEKMLRNYPQSAPAHHLLGSALMATGEIDRAMTSFRQASSLAPGFADPVLALAGLHLRKGDFTAALGPLRAMVQQRPDLVRARLLLADTYRGMGNLNAALAIYRQMSEASPTTPENFMLMGMVLLQQAQRAPAREAFNKALQADPNFLPAVEQLVDLDLRENQPQAALQRAEALIARLPKSGGPYLLLAKIFLIQKQNDKAEAALLKAIELDPNAPPPYFVLARLYMDAGELPKALARLQTVLDKNPKDAAALMLTGVLNDQQKNYAPARDAYERLLAVNPNSVAALNNLAYLYSEFFGQLDRAQELAQKARDLLPAQPHAADTLGWVLYKKRQYARAQILIEEAAGKLPTSGAVQYHLGMTHYMLGEEAPAREALKRALELEKDFAGAEEARQAQELLALDIETQAAAARPLLEKAVAARPDDTVALTRLALVYERTGSREKAAEIYEKALKSSPNNLNASLSLIRVYAARGETAKAIELANNTRKFALDDPALAHVLGRLRYQIGESPQAISLLQEASRKQPDVPGLWFDLGVAFYSVGKVSDAESALQRALELSRSFPQAGEARAFLELIPPSTGADGGAGATARIEAALKTDPNHAPALMALGRSQEKKGDTAAAYETYGKLLARYPDFVLAKRQLAIMYAADGRETDKAYDFAFKAREAFSDDPELGKAYGMILYRKKEYSRAVKALQDSAEQRRTDGELMYYLGMSRRELKDNTGAKQALQSAIDLKVKADLATEARRALTEIK